MTSWAGTCGPPHLPRFLSAVHYFHILKVKVKANEQRMVQLFGRDWLPEKKYNRKSCTVNSLLTDTSTPIRSSNSKMENVLCFFNMLIHHRQNVLLLNVVSLVPCYKIGVICRPKVILKVWNCCRSIHTCISQYLHYRIVSL